MKDACTKDDVYANLQELCIKKESTRSVGKDEAPTTKKESSSNITKVRIILAALVLIIILFLILLAITSLLLTYSDDQQRMVREGVENLKKNLDNVEQHFLQNIKAVNKTLETICGTCPSGWNSIGLFCYYFSSDKLTWANASNECIRKGSALLSPKNKEDVDALKAFLEPNIYWIGLRRDKDPAKWKWLDGSVMSFSKWKEGEPNNYGSKEDCAESYLGEWNDNSCEKTMKYICKKGCCC